MTCVYVMITECETTQPNECETTRRCDETTNKWKHGLCKTADLFLKIVCMELVWKQMHKLNLISAAYGICPES